MEFVFISYGIVEINIINFKRSEREIVSYLYVYVKVLQHVSIVC